MRGFKGFSWEELARFGVQRQGKVVRVPYRDRQGRFYRAKFFALHPPPRGGGPRSWWDRQANKPQIPYGAETLRFGGDRVFLTEGESDAWALRVANPGVPVLGLPGASSWKSEWSSALDPFEKVYAIFDGDDAGDELYDAVCWSVPRTRVVTPLRGRDTRDVIQKFGVAVLRELIRVADEEYAVRAAADPLATTKETFNVQDRRFVVVRRTPAAA